MAANKLAVIDLGTNTFHLLIVERDKSQLGFSEVYRDRHYVFLAEEGIDLIAEAAMLRAKKAIDAFSKELLKHDGISLTMVGTEALRIASNGPTLTQYISEKLGKAPGVISGGREAELIYKGNALLVDDHIESYLIMDIGGGSTEFIWVNEQKVSFSKSYPLGVSKLYNQLEMNDPLSEENLIALKNHMMDCTKDMQDQIGGAKIQALVGASGTFEVISQMLSQGIPSDQLIDVSIEEFHQLYEQVIPLNIDERRSLGTIPESRIKLIPTGIAMMEVIVNSYDPKGIMVSPFAIKEGLISEWLNLG